jgi:uncharacterized membrane protein (DUF106 family)
MLTVYLVIALIILFLYLHPWVTDSEYRVDIIEVLIGIGLGVLWPIWIPLVILGWLFLYFAFRISDVKRS